MTPRFSGMVRIGATAGLLFGLPVAGPGRIVGTADQNMAALVYPAARILLPSRVDLITSGTTFQPYTGSLTVSYRARTTPVGGGTITLRVGPDFAPSGGPRAADGTLKYICGSATLGTGCSGVQTATTTSQSPVLTLPASACTGGGGACSAQDPNSITLQFNLENDPGYSTGSYSAQLTLTISSI
jgi:hypothetical protein